MSRPDIIEGIDRALEQIRAFGPIPHFIRDAMFPHQPVRVRTDDHEFILAHPDYWERFAAEAERRYPLVAKDRLTSGVFSYSGVEVVDLQSPKGRELACWIGEGFKAKGTYVRAADYYRVYPDRQGGLL